MAFKVFGGMYGKKDTYFNLSHDEDGDISLYVVDEAGRPLSNGLVLYISEHSGKLVLCNTCPEDIGLCLNENGRIVIDID